MKYYLGPWVLDTSDGEPTYRAPTGTLGAIDLGILPQMGVATESRRGCFCWTSGGPLASEWDLVGEGDCRSLSLTAGMQSKFLALVGYSPNGDRLVDAVMDCMIGGSDPDGSDGPLPMVPETSSLMKLWMPGHSLVLSERFEWGKLTSRGNSHTAKLKDLLRRQFQSLFDDAKVGRLRDAQHHRRVLDAWCEKYKVDDWKEFVPQALQAQVPGRLPHETTVSDNFNRADSTGLGGSWTNLAGSFDVSSNEARGSSTTGAARSRYDSDLSSSDSEVQASTIRYQTVGTIQALGVLGRHDSSADTNYAWAQRTTGTTRLLQKIITGTATVLTSDTTAPPALPYTNKLSCNGSSLKVYVDGTEIATLATTDTSIASGLRAGLKGGGALAAADRSIQDDFTATDISVGSGVLYTQLERGVRGLKRGMYTKWG